MIYPPPDHRRPHGRASTMELALWIVGMAVFAAFVLVAAGVQPPFDWSEEPGSYPTLTATPLAWPTAVVPLPASAGVAAPTPSSSPINSQGFPGWSGPTAPAWPTTEVPTAPFPLAQPTLALWPVAPTPYAQPTLPPQASPQWGRSLATATTWGDLVGTATTNGTPTAQATATATLPSAYP